MPLKINPATACFDMVTSPGSGTAVISIDIDSSTAPGTDPVLPTVAGKVTIAGAAVASHSIPLETHSRAANEFNIEVQVASDRTAAPADTNDAGICSFDDTAFVVDANGYVTLVGGAGPAVDSIMVDGSLAPGTNPVVPDAAGKIYIGGSTISAVGFPVRSFARGVPNRFNIEVQLASSVSGPPVFALDAGLAVFEASEFDVNANGYVNLVAPVPQAPGAYNLAMFYDGGTGVTTIKGADANDLSATNPAYIVLNSNVTTGALVTKKLIANYQFEDSVHASSVFAGSLFGFDTGDVTGTYISGINAIPFYIYAACDATDDNLIFFTSRISTYTGASGSVLYNATSGSADLAWHQLTLDSVTVADYYSKAAVLVGSMNLTKTAGDDWTVVNVNNASVGMGKYARAAYGVPLGTMGAAASSIFVDNGGTAPTTSSGVLDYNIDPFTGICSVNFSFNTGGAPATAVDAILTLPIRGSRGGQLQNIMILSPSGPTTGKNTAVVYRNVAGDLRQAYLSKEDLATARWQYDEFAAGTLNTVTGTVIYFL